MIGFLTFLLIVFAAGFIYLTIQGRWKVTVGENDDSDLSLATRSITTGTIENANKIDVSNAPKTKLNGAVTFEETYNDLPKSHPRVNQVHMERRMFERPRRKVKK